MNGVPDTARVGVEIEFAGLDTTEAAMVLARAIGGDVEVESPHRAHVRATPLGNVELELDMRYVHPLEDDSGLIERALEGAGMRIKAAELISPVVPVEIVTEPLAPCQFAELDRALAALVEAGAVGTGARALYAFGVHLNVALRGGSERAIRVAAAFTFAERWIREQWTVDPSRRVVPFIDPYPKGWRVDLAEAMEGGRMPDLDAFIRLYADYNPTRNRGLDLWPLLGHLAPETSRRALGERVKNARPAFHYRWPDSRLGEPGWSPWDAFGRWLLVERAADDDGRLERLRAASHGAESGKGRLSAYNRTCGEVMAP